MDSTLFVMSRWFVVGVLCTLMVAQAGAAQRIGGRPQRKWIKDYTNGLSGALATIADLKVQVATLTKVQQSQQSVIGYKYAARHSVHSNADNGRLMTLRFTKKRQSSVLRLSFSQNSGVYSGTTLEARWYFKIDGQECKSPTKIDMILRYDDTGRHWLGVPSVLKGICYATSKGHIGKGTHVISVYIGRPVGRHRGPDAYSGWKSTAALEVQEIPAPY